MVAGGWALDLHLGALSRPHADLDLALYRHDQGVAGRWLAERGWTLRTLVGGAAQPWDPAEPIPPPLHELHATHGGHQAELELLLNEGGGEDWRYRRAPALSRPRALAQLRSAEGIPYLAPELVLLFKSAAPGEKDHSDFARVFPRLAEEPARWLRDALRSLDPRHPWLS
jgi:hypothetical protein